MSKLSLRTFINMPHKSLSSFWFPDVEVNSKWTLSLNPKLNDPKQSRVNKLYTKYSWLEFQHKRFRLLNGKIISKMPLWKFTLIYCLRTFQNKQVTTMISYVNFFLFWKFPEVSQWLYMLSEIAQSFYWHGKENSREFQTFLETSMTIHFNF